MTETAALITLNHPFRVARGTMGKPLPGREVKLQPDGEVLVRGPMISPATWSGGALHQRAGEWLATGDLAEAQPTGELRFLGRKSETIVTGAGLNVHPEDLEAVLEQEPDVAACAVVPIETPLGPEPCAVLALRSTPDRAAAIIQSANTRLAEFQRIRRWALWPDPDLPRTSTGKIKRPAVTAWLAEREAASQTKTSPASTDWLLTLIAQITGEQPPSNHNNQDLRLSEDLHLDSLGRVQLLETLEERFSVSLNQEQYDASETLNDLRRLINNPVETELDHTRPTPQPEAQRTTNAPTNMAPKNPPTSLPKTPIAVTNYVYPSWPWLLPLRWLRTTFVELAMRPLVWLLAAPRVVRTPSASSLNTAAPLLIIANHVTAYDVPLLLYALPRAMRDRTAAAMSAEMLDDFLHARNQQPRLLNPLGPLVWLLITELFNVFPLPRRRDFQRSFAHAGRALDRGFHVIVFPEGTRSPDGTLATFRPGIGLLVKQSFTAVLPIALHGLGDLKIRRRRWFRSGALEVRVGQPLHFASNDCEATITARLHEEIEKLLAAR